MNAEEAEKRLGEMANTIITTEFIKQIEKIGVILTSMGAGMFLSNIGFLEKIFFLLMGIMFWGIANYTKKNILTNDNK